MDAVQKHMVFFAKNSVVRDLNDKLIKSYLLIDNKLHRFFYSNLFRVWPNLFISIQKMGEFVFKVTLKQVLDMIQ